MSPQSRGSLEVDTQFDEGRLAAYLETETARNVRFYERFGFETIDCAEVLGNPNWFMWRSPR